LQEVLCVYRQRFVQRSNTVDSLRNDRPHPGFTEAQCIGDNSLLACRDARFILCGPYRFDRMFMDLQQNMDGDKKRRYCRSGATHARLNNCNRRPLPDGGAASAQRKCDEQQCRAISSGAKPIQ
jgi:hypothetical protein